MLEEEYQFVVLIALATSGMLLGYLSLQFGDRLMRRHRASKHRNFGGGWENAARNAVEEAASGGAVGYAAFVHEEDAIRVRPTATGLTITWQKAGEAKAYFEVMHEDEASAVFELLREIFWSEQSSGQSSGTVPEASLWETSSRRPLERMGDRKEHEACISKLKGGFRVEETVRGTIRGAAVIGDLGRGKRLCELLARCRVPELVAREKPKRRLLTRKRHEPKPLSSPYKRMGAGPQPAEARVAESEADAPSTAGGSFDEARRVARETVPSYQPDEILSEHRDHGFDKLFR